MFTLNKRGSEYYTVDTSNMQTIGEIYRENGGFFVFAFTSETESGYFNEYFFTFVAHHLFTFVSYHLKSLNAEWENKKPT